MKEGDRVTKKDGYGFPGIIVSRFTTISGEERFVVESTYKMCRGLLHIYSKKNLRLVSNDRRG